MQFSFGEYKTNITIGYAIPAIESFVKNHDNALIIADENTESIARKIRGGSDVPVCILKSGEENKNWQQVELILLSAVKNKLGRDCTFIGAGGGVICDLTAFAASVYMRGCSLALVPTTLLAMVDASVGGKTGLDFIGVKNLAGTFYPAENILIPLDCLASLAQTEWKNGFAEIIKTAVLAESFSENEYDDFLKQIKKSQNFDYKNSALLSCIEKSVNYKAGIVSEDLKETGIRKLLNLGHTFGHALESVLGFGNVSHGEAVAWGMIRACKLGILLGITPASRAEKITGLLKSFGYKDVFKYDKNAIIDAMRNDKKKRNGKLTFIIPDAKSAEAVVLESENDLDLLGEALE